MKRRSSNVGRLAQKKQRTNAEEPIQDGSSSAEKLAADPSICLITHSASMQNMCTADMLMDMRLSLHTAVKQHPDVIWADLALFCIASGRLLDQLGPKVASEWPPSGLQVASK